MKDYGYQAYNQWLNMFDAEEFCVGQGGHLASVTSEVENIEIKMMTAIASYGFNDYVVGWKPEWSQLEMA